MDRPTFEMSADARLLYQHLKTIKVGQTVKYSDLSAVISQPVNGSFPALRTAREKMLKEDQVVFDPVIAVGMVRLGDEDIVSAADRDVSKMRRAAKRGVRKLASISDYSALPREKQIAHTARMSLMATVASMTTNSSVSKIEQKASGGTSRELPIAETMAALVPSIRTAAE